MFINMVLLSLITIRATGIAIKASSADSLSRGIVSKNDLANTTNPSTDRHKPTRRPAPSSLEDGKYLDDAAFLPLKYFQIQYAPLPGRFEKSAGVRPSTKIIAVNLASTEKPSEETLKKIDIRTNIAPYFDVHRQSYRSFVPGYNIEVLQSVNRNPSYNAIFKSYPEIFPRKKDYKRTFIEDNVEPLTPEHVVTKATIPTLKPDTRFVLKPNLINAGVEQTLEKIDRQNHRIHLNLARVYSQGLGIPNLPIHDKDYSINIRLRKKTLLPSLYPEAFD